MASACILRAVEAQSWVGVEMDVHIAYELEVRLPGVAPVLVQRRFRDFADLASKLRLQRWAADLPPLPTKHWFRRTKNNADAQEERQVGLNDFLSCLVLQPMALKDAAVCTFLGAAPEKACVAGSALASPQLPFKKFIDDVVRKAQTCFPGNPATECLTNAQIEATAEEEEAQIAEIAGVVPRPEIAEEDDEEEEAGKEEAVSVQPDRVEPVRVQTWVDILEETEKSEPDEKCELEKTSEPEDLRFLNPMSTGSTTSTETEVGVETAAAIVKVPDDDVVKVPDDGPVVMKVMPPSPDEKESDDYLRGWLSIRGATYEKESKDAPYEKESKFNESRPVIANGLDSALAPLPTDSIVRRQSARIKSKNQPPAILRRSSFELGVSLPTSRGSFVPSVRGSASMSPPPVVRRSSFEPVRRSSFEPSDVSGPNASPPRPARELAGRATPVRRISLSPSTPVPGPRQTLPFDARTPVPLNRSQTPMQRYSLTASQPQGRGTPLKGTAFAVQSRPYWAGAAAAA
jgi:hypothetical protein